MNEFMEKSIYIFAENSEEKIEVVRDIQLSFCEYTVQKLPDTSHAIQCKIMLLNRSIFILCLLYLTDCKEQFF